MQRALIAALAALSIASPALAQAPEAAAAPPTLSVTGHGSATAEPDIAMVQVGVETQAETAAAALDQNSAAVERVIAEIRQAGIESKDIQTTNLWIDPVYDHRHPQPEGERPALVGFRVVNEVAARIRDIDLLGQVMSAVVAAGANRINSLNFGMEDEQALLEEARRDAMANARRIAEVYAEAAGVELGRILSIDSTTERRVPVGGPAMRMEAMDSAAVPIERGETSVAATVDVVWEIAPAE